MTDAQIPAVVIRLNGNDTAVAVGLRTVGEERGAIWLCLCELWAGVKPRGNRDAEYFPEALMIVAVTDGERPALRRSGPTRSRPHP